MKNIRTDNGQYYETRHFLINNSTRISILRRIKTIVTYPLRNTFFKILSLFMPKTFAPRKYGLAICSIFKDEAPFLKEWIEYHKMLGVEHFYMYNNNSSDAYKEILLPYIANGVVTLIDWPETPGQLTAYRNWYESYRKDCLWATFLDIDEFICPHYSFDIKSWLGKYGHYPVIKLDWLMFGTSGKLKHDYTLTVLEQYTQCWSKRSNIGKVLYNCHYDIANFGAEVHHRTIVKWHGLKIPPFNEFGNICVEDSYQWISLFKTATIQVNHYYSKACDILEGKLNKGDAMYVDYSWKTTNLYWLKEMNCRRSDYVAHRFLSRLKLSLKSGGDGTDL